MNHAQTIVLYQPMLHTIAYNLVRCKQDAEGYRAGDVCKMAQYRSRKDSEYKSVSHQGSHKQLPESSQLTEAKERSTSRMYLKHSIALRKLTLPILILI